MSGYIIECVESRLDDAVMMMNNPGIHDVSTVVRDPAVTPILPTQEGLGRNRGHVVAAVTPTRSKRFFPQPENVVSATESHFGWLEQYVLDRRKKQDSIKSLASVGWSMSSDDESANHLRRHRRTLSRRDSLGEDLMESLKTTPLDVAEQAKSQVVDAIFQAEP